MCLYDEKRFRFTLKPIKVYKIVIVNNNGFFSPFRKTKLNKYMFGCLGHPIKVVEEDRYQFGEGFIHAYTSLKSASRIIKEMNGAHPQINFKIITGYIPRFTRYAKENYTYNYDYVYDDSKRNTIIKEICARIMVFPTLNKKE